MAEVDVRKSVERGVELSERERARIDIGGDDVSSVARREQAEDAASSPNVESPFDTPPGSQRVADARGWRVRSDVVGRRIAFCSGKIVGRDQQRIDRHDPSARSESRAGVHEADRLRRLHGVTPECSDRILARDGQLEVQRTNGNPEVRLRQSSIGDGRVLALVSVIVLGQRLERVLGIADAPKRSAERARRRRVGNWILAHVGQIMPSTKKRGPAEAEPLVVQEDVLR